MDQSPSLERSRFTSSQEIPHILWNPKVLHRVYNSPPPVAILYQINEVHATFFNVMGADLLILIFHIGKGLNRPSCIFLEYPGEYYPGCGFIQFIFII
jgi:hypothetical protein